MLAAAAPVPAGARSDQGSMRQAQASPRLGLNDCGQKPGRSFHGWQARSSSPPNTAGPQDDDSKYPADYVDAGQRIGGRLTPSRNGIGPNARKRVAFTSMLVPVAHARPPRSSRQGYQAQDNGACPGGPDCSS